MVQNTQTWDDIRYAVFFLHRILESGWLLENSLASGALDNLKSLSRYLFDLAVIPVQGIYINKLTQADEDSLELQFAKLLDYDLKNCDGLPVSLKSTPVIIAEFKVCLNYFKHNLFFSFLLLFIIIAHSMICRCVL